MFCPFPAQNLSRTFQPKSLYQRPLRSLSSNSLFLFNMIFYHSPLIHPLQPLWTPGCSSKPLLFFFFFFVFLSFCLFRAAHVAYGGSQARSPIRATGAGLHQSHGKQDRSHFCDLHHSHSNARSLTH